MFCQCGAPIKQLALSRYDLLRSAGNLRGRFLDSAPTAQASQGLLGVALNNR
jgi:hypothetical protein